MKIGIIGSGLVGQTLGNAFLAEGHDVMLGTRDISKAEVVKWKNNNAKGLIGTFSDAAKYGELLIVCTAGDAAESAIKMAGIENFSGKVVIDTTNPIDKKPPVNGVLRFFTGANESLMGRLQHLVPDARFIKAFNSVGSDLMYKPVFKEGKPTMFICGNDEGAKKIVTGILNAFGFEPEDMGKVEAAATIESLCILWCIPGFLRNEWSHAFKLLKP
jgi:predicted dinucleotide-binding enzyme